MKLFRKFCFYTFFPLLVISIIDILSSRSLDSFKEPYRNISTFGYFAITAFVLVYFLDWLDKNNFTLLKKIFASISLLIILIFIFDTIIIAIFNEEQPLINTLMRCLVIIIIFLFEFLFQNVWKNLNRKKSIEFIDKKSVYLKFGLVLFLFLFTIYSFSVFEMLLDVEIDLKMVKEFITNPILFILFAIGLSFFTIWSLTKVPQLKNNRYLITLIAIFFCTILYSIFYHKINLFARFTVSFLISLFINLAIVTFLFYRSQQFNSQINIHKLTFLNSKNQSQYFQLKQQVAPHFLFNNLNTLISFIEINPKKAVAFGHQLSNTYRHYLKNEKEDFVLLTEELLFIQEHLGIYKAKFEEAFLFSIDVNSSDNEYILSITLQEIIDNIFKHNTIDDEDPLEITITKSNDFLEIKNTIFSKKSEQSSKLGLENIIKRYSFLSKQIVEIHFDENYFVVKLPILNLVN